MRYLRKFKGDEITADDLMPITLDSLSLEIPQLKETKPGKNKLDQLPIRVKTRFRGGRNAPGRRVVSTPIFDLVGPSRGMDLLPPPMIHDTSSVSSPKPIQRDMPKVRRSLPSLPEMPSQHTQKSLPTIPQVRHVSIPLTTFDKSLHGHNRSLESYTSIIDSYRQNAPFGTISPPTRIHRGSFASSLDSSPEAAASSSSSSSEYSFDDSADEVISRPAHSPQSSVTTQSTMDSHSNAIVVPDFTDPRNTPRQSHLNIPKRKPPPKSMTQQDFQNMTSQPPPPYTPQDIKQRPVSYSTTPQNPGPMWDVTSCPPAPTNRTPYMRAVSQPVGRLMAN